MNWKDIRKGMTVYHGVYTHWGPGGEAVSYAILSTRTGQTDTETIHGPFESLQGLREWWAGVGGGYHISTVKCPSPPRPEPAPEEKQ